MAKKRQVKKTSSKASVLQLMIERINPDNIRSTPVNDILVTHSQNEFFVTFSSVEPPQILDPKELSKLKEINAIARAKIVISPDFLEQVIKTLSTNLETFKNQKG